jgi:hypothetical protein
LVLRLSVGNFGDNLGIKWQFIPNGVEKLWITFAGDVSGSTVIHRFIHRFWGWLGITLEVSTSLLVSYQGRLKAGRLNWGVIQLQSYPHYPQPYYYYVFI